MSCSIPGMAVLDAACNHARLGRDQPVTGRDQKKRPQVAQEGKGRDQPVTSRDHSTLENCECVFSRSSFLGSAVKWLLKL